MIIPAQLHTQVHKFTAHCPDPTAAAIEYAYAAGLEAAAVSLATHITHDTTSRNDLTEHLYKIVDRVDAILIQHLPDEFTRPQTTSDTPPATGYPPETRTPMTEQNSAPNNITKQEVDRRIKLREATNLVWSDATTEGITEGLRELGFPLDADDDFGNTPTGKVLHRAIGAALHYLTAEAKTHGLTIDDIIEARAYETGEKNMGHSE